MADKTNAVDPFRAIADPTRRAVLDLLASDELTVSELVERFHMSQPAISQHLRVLRQAGLVRGRREGRKRVYQIRPEQLKPISEWVSQYERFWKQKLRNLGNFLENGQ
jgi:DNA-binding transcriptional ArsR family regulator